ncbi:MAG: DUF177 domain-containing protein [Bacillota bacterium]
MKVNIVSLLDDPVQSLAVDGQISLERLEEAGGWVEFATPVAVHARLSSTGRGILAEGQASAVARLECSRCLASYELPVGALFAVEFRKEAGASPGKESTATEVEIQPLTGNYVELADTVRQSLILALPMKPLCQENCRGLCPECGVDLNQGRCRCPSQGDPRLSALAKLLEKHEK